LQLLYTPQRILSGLGFGFISYGQGRMLAQEIGVVVEVVVGTGVVITGSQHKSTEHPSGA
jgi:hypothetical protein